MADATIAGREALLARLAKIPEVTQAAAARALKAGVDELVEAEKRAAPVSDLEGHPGELRDSIVAYANPDRPLSWRIIVGARDAAGRLYGRYVEFGHGNARPRPFFFPTYRAQKKRIRSQVFSEVRQALKTLFPE